MVKNIINNSRNLFNQQNNTILSAAIIIAASYAASAILGLVRNRLLAGTFFGGQESELDVYFAAFVIPDTIFQLLVVGALSAAFIPVYSRYLKQGSRQANHLANATLNSLLIILSSATLLVAIFAHPISNLVAHFPPAQTSLMASLMRLMLLSQVFFTISTFLTGIIQSHRRFLIPAIAPLLYNLGIIIGVIFLTPTLGIYGAAWGVVIGAILHLLIQVPLARHLGYSYRLIFSFRHPGVRTISRLMLPRTLALAVSQAERWIAVVITSLLSAGSLSIFNFARQLYTMPITLFGVSLGQASFPNLSSQADGDLVRFNQTLSQTLLQILFFSLPASALLLILRIPIVRLAFGADSFPWSATLLTGKTLALFTLSIAPQAASHLLVRAYYALEDTKTPLIISLLTVALNVILSLSLSLSLGLGILGIALAVSISDILSFLLLSFLIQRRTGLLHVYGPAFKMFVATFFTLASLWLPFRLLDQFVFDTTRTIPLIALTLITSLIGLLVYFAFSYLLGVKELDAVARIFHRLGNWRKILSRSEEVIEPPALSSE